MILLAPSSDGIKVFQAKANGVQHPVASGASGIGGVGFGSLSKRQAFYIRVFLILELWDIRWGRWDAFPKHLFEHPDPPTNRTGPVGK